MRWLAVLLMASAFCVAPLRAAERELPEGVAVEDLWGYENCVVLRNDTTKVVLCPAAGGRVLEYVHQGKKSLYLAERDDARQSDGAARGKNMSAGRFDIGPELVIPKHPVLWAGKWSYELTGPRSVRLTSQKDEATGVLLVRDFTLAATGSDLTCKQTIQNVSDKPNAWCHWSRTFAQGGGKVVIPLSDFSRFPNHYVMYEQGHVINVRPEDPQIRRREDVLEVLAAPRNPKLGFDSKEGWLAYLMPNDMAFIKRFRVDPEGVYNEAAGLTISVWYPDFMPTVELEPIGPAVTIAPGETSSFTEHWRLAPFPFPGEADADLNQLRKIADAPTPPTPSPRDR